MAQNVQRGTRGAADSFNRFVEGDGRPGAEPERKDFWDSFGGSDEGASASVGSRAMGVASAAAKKGSAIGTTAVKKTDGKDDWSEDF